MLVKKTIALNKLRDLNKRIRVVRGGTSAGKTICILLILIDYAIKNEGKEISVVSESIPHLRRGCVKDFTSLLKSLNRYKENQFNRSTLKYTFTNGSYIEFFSSDQPDKLRGARRTDLYINECNNVPFDAYNQLAVRTSGTIWLDYNPSNLFWVDKEIIGQNDSDYITLTYKDNDVLDESIIKEIEKAKEKGKTSTYWANWWRVYGLGEVGSLEGVCIPDWKEIDNIPVEARLLGYGLDFGYSVDPTTIIALYKWNNAYIYDEVLYKKGMLNRDISRFLSQNNINENVIADSAEPKSIEELHRMGFNVKPAKKGPDSIRAGIDIMRRRRIYVHEDSRETQKEFRNYKWMTDKNGRVLNKPVDDFNHSVDAVRYVCLLKLSKKTGQYILR